MVANLTFMSLIHFEFIFVYGVKKWSRLILFIYLAALSLSCST